MFWKAISSPFGYQSPALRYKSSFANATCGLSATFRFMTLNASRLAISATAENLNISDVQQM